MPITVILPGDVAKNVFEGIFARFHAIDEQFSPFKDTSEVTKINRGLPETEWSEAMKDIVDRAELTKIATNGYFDVWHDGRFDPSGIVKGWAIDEAAAVAHAHGVDDYYIEAGGDIALSGHNGEGNLWRVGIRSPFNRDEHVQVIHATSCGIATSGTAIRGQHIYNPHDDRPIQDILSLTVVGPTIYDADRFATAAFAMGRQGISFIETLDGFEGYMIDDKGIATMTSGLETYTSGSAS